MRLRLASTPSRSSRSRRRREPRKGRHDVYNVNALDIADRMTGLGAISLRPAAKCWGRPADEPCAFPAHKRLAHNNWMACRCPCRWPAPRNEVIQRRPPGLTPPADYAPLLRSSWRSGLTGLGGLRAGFGRYRGDHIQAPDLRCGSDFSASSKPHVHHAAGDRHQGLRGPAPLDRGAGLSAVRAQRTRRSPPRMRTKAIVHKALLADHAAPIEPVARRFARRCRVRTRTGQRGQR